MTTDRLQEDLALIIEAMLPRILPGMLGVLCRWEYRVTSVTPGNLGVPTTVGGTPVDPVRCPFGDLPAITVWPSTTGSPCIPAMGSIVVVAFHDGNPAKPAIVAVDPSVPATIPDASPAKVSVAGLLATFATGLNPTTLAAQAGLLVTGLTPLL